MARSATTAEVESSLSALRGRGAEVVVVQADVSDTAQVRDALATIRASMPPLRGVFHAAGVLADATIDGMDSSTRARGVGTEGARWEEPARVDPR